MSAIPKPLLTPEEYLVRERKAEFKSEYYRGEMFAMASASREHNSVKDNLIIEIGTRLKGSPCRTFSSDQRVKVSPTGLYTYPDIVVVCGKAEYDSLDKDTLLNPVAIIEVLSPSTENYDRGAKFRQYEQLPSMKEYILVAQNEPVCERFVRQGDSDWLRTIVTGLAGELLFATLPVRIPMADIYNGVEFPSEPTRGPVMT
ncbi:MAG TPA: Uma2 family endonuclease [Gemmataceae bacterium]|jgi:Uma2 family endonuclease|nr:Uma2 family endonuclease [Gemmataceae bacterium]